MCKIKNAIRTAYLEQQALRRVHQTAVMLSEMPDFGPEQLLSHCRNPWLFLDSCAQRWRPAGLTPLRWRRLIARCHHSAAKRNGMLVWSMKGLRFSFRALIASTDQPFTGPGNAIGD